MTNLNSVQICMNIHARPPPRDAAQKCAMCVPDRYSRIRTTSSLYVPDVMGRSFERNAPRTANAMPFQPDRPASESKRNKHVRSQSERGLLCIPVIYIIVRFRKNVPFGDLPLEISCC